MSSSRNPSADVGSLTNFFEKIGNQPANASMINKSSNIPNKAESGSSHMLTQELSSFSATNPFLDDIRDSTSSRVSNPFDDPPSNPFSSTNSLDIDTIEYPSSPKVIGDKGGMSIAGNAKAVKTPPPPPKKPDFLQSNPQSLTKSGLAYSKSINELNNRPQSSGGYTDINSRANIFKHSSSVELDSVPRYPSKSYQKKQNSSLSANYSFKQDNGPIKVFSNSSLNGPLISNDSQNILFNLDDKGKNPFLSPDDEMDYNTFPNIKIDTHEDSPNSLAPSFSHAPRRVNSTASVSESISKASIRSYNSMVFATSPSKEYKMNKDFDIPEQYEKHMKTRINVIKEIIDTEEAFTKDLIILRDIFSIPSRDARVFVKQDWRLLFFNLDDVITFSLGFRQQLLNANTNTPADSYIGRVFLESLPEMENVFVEYCKNNEAALAKIAEFSQDEASEDIKSFLLNCQKEMQGKTGAWDLASLIIKPVQRIMKYPLLLAQLLKVTPSDFVDHRNIWLAAENLEQVADRINELKKRKDIVEKYVDRKGPRDIVHGVKKMVLRSAQQVRRGIAGSDLPEDQTYIALKKQLYDSLEQVEKFQEECVNWLNKLRNYVGFIEAIGLYYRDLNGTYSSKYYTATTRLANGLFNEVQNEIKEKVFPIIEKLLKMYQDPSMVVDKCEQKRLDYERIMHMQSKGEDLKKHHNGAIDEYYSIRAQLLDELPAFFNLSGQLLDKISGKLIRIQMKVHGEIAKSIEPFAAIQKSKYSDTDMIEANHKVEEILREISKPFESS